MADPLRRLLRLAGWIAVSLVALLCASYLVDLALLQWKFHGHGKAFDKVTVRRYYAVPHKDGKEEYLEDDPRAQTCVHSLFPHSASPPCWYLTRHREQRVDM